MVSTVSRAFGFPYAFPQVTNVVPFTYRDGQTYLSLLEAMRAYITNDLVPSVDAVIAEFGVSVEDAINEVERRIDFINNKSGNIDIQRIALTQNHVVTFDPGWPSNQPVTFVFTQDAAGGRTIALPAFVDGSYTLNPAPNSVTTFALVPSGNGRWYVSQVPATRAAFDALVAELTVPVLDALRDDVDAVDTRVTAANAAIAANGAAILDKSRNYSGLYSARPAASTVREGDAYHASDVRETYQRVGGVWVVSSPPGLLGAYSLTNVAERLPSSGTDVDWKDVDNFSVTFTPGERPVRLSLSGNIATGYTNTIGRASVWVGSSIRLEVKAEIARAITWQSFTRSVILYGLTPGQTYTAQVRLAPDTSRGADMSWTRLDGNAGDPTVLTVEGL